MTKVEKAIQKIKNAEKLALEINQDGFYLCFSGGKDSIVLYDITKKANVKFTAHMNLSTVDAPQVLQFVRKNYPDVILHKPKKSIFKIIKDHGMLPTPKIRFCCAEIKEVNGAGYVNLLGIRKAESVKRSKRQELEVQGYKYSNSLDQFNIDFESKIVCVNGKDKILFSPLLDWTDNNIWRYIHENKLEVPELYRMGFNRIGCLFCPMASVKTQQLTRKYFPKFEYAYKKAIKYIMENNDYTHGQITDVDEVFEYWTSKLSLETFLKRKKDKLKFNENKDEN